MGGGCSRRRFLAGAAKLAGAAAAALAVMGHTPYRQWQVYRQRHLLVVAGKTDPAAYALAQSVAAMLAKHLPDSQARPSRAPTLERVASLIGTGQMDLAVLGAQDAAALHAGRGRFAEAGPVDLRALFAVGDHLLVCREDFPPPHARLVVETLDANRAELAAATAGVPGKAAGAVPPHPAVLEYLAEGAGAAPR